MFGSSSPFRHIAKAVETGRKTPGMQSRKFGLTEKVVCFNHHCEERSDEAIHSSSFRDGPKDQTSDAQLRIGESRDSGLDAEPVIGPRFARTRWHRPGMTESGLLL